MTIKFGTDGWRAIVGEDFTPENVTQVIQAFADLYAALPEAGRPVVVGYDRRNQSPETARLVAEVLTRNGITTFLSESYCPTPMVSWTVVQMQAAAGIMVTASHNPPHWNGIKFKESYGGAASPAFTDPIEAQIRKNAATPRTTRTAHPKAATLLHTFTATAYVEHLRRFVDLAAIAKAKHKILYDPMYGAGAGYLSQIVDGITEIHGHRDIHFGGVHPEPIIPYVNEAIATMRGGGYDLCVITDGDADRIGAVDETGRFITSHEIYAVLLDHVIRRRGWTGNVVKSITTTQMIDRICEQHGLQLTTTPVGFKYISPALNAPNMLAGGEESGGIGFPRHVCERDGVLCALLLLEAMALGHASISQLVAEMQRQYGPYCYRRIDLKLTVEQMQRARERLQSGDVPTTLCGRRMKLLNRIDGFHFLRDDNSWLLVRPSGTEPLFRTYAEARSPDDVEALLQEARVLVGLD